MCLHDLSYPLCYHFTDTAMVVWQSPTSITVSSFREAVALYCVASSHGKCTYHRSLEGGGQLFHLPLLYISMKVAYISVSSKLEKRKKYQAGLSEYMHYR